MGLLGRWLVLFVTVLLVSTVLPFVRSDGLGPMAVFALLLALLNAVLRPILVILTLPLTIMTLGLFAIVINLFVFWLAQELVPGFQIGGGVLGLVGAALAVSIVSGIIGGLK